VKQHIAALLAYKTERDFEDLDTMSPYERQRLKNELRKYTVPTLKAMEIENPKRHIEYFKHITEWFKDAKDINIDESCVNVSRLRLFSIDDLVEKIEASRKSIAPNYDQYLKLAIVFANELGENGRSYFHRVCCLDSKYDSKDCDELFDDILKRNYTSCTVGTLIH